MMTRTIHHSETPSGNARSRNLQLRSIAIYARIYTAGNTSFYPSLVRMPMASFLPFPCPDFHSEKTPSHFP